MGVTTEKIIAHMCASKKWRWSVKKNANWFIVDARTIYFNEDDGKIVCADKAFEAVVNEAFTIAMRAVMEEAGLWTDEEKEVELTEEVKAELDRMRANAVAGKMMLPEEVRVAYPAVYKLLNPEK